MLLNEELTYRQIFMDGRELERDPNPTWMGYSVGHWDKDTLVIESNGFNDRSWIGSGYPHTEALHVTERLRRIDFGHMELQRTLSDPGALIEPLSLTMPLELDADTEMLEYVCNENEKDLQHIVGKVSDFKKNEVAVAPEILARYTGSYVLNQPGFLQGVLKISLVNSKLTIDWRFGANLPLIALSATHFAAQFGYVDVVTDDRGMASHLMVTLPEGVAKAERQR
jgi:hypothetical protein